jgi:hypothetical protein
MKIAIVGFGHVGMGANACLAASDRKIACVELSWAALLPTQRRPFLMGTDTGSPSLAGAPQKVL